MKKILMMSDYFNAGGVSYVMNELSRGFSQNHEVKMLFFEKTPLAYESKIPIFFINQSPYKLRFLAKQLNKIIYPIKLFVFIKAFNPDVIISFKTKPNITAIIANFFAKKPLIIGEHGIHYEITNKTAKIRKLLYPYASFLSVLSKEDFLFYSFVKNKIIMPNPLNLASLKQTKCKKENIILSVARLESQKNIDFLLHSLALIKSELKGWRVLLAGDGVLRAELEKLANELGVSVEFLGHVEDIGVLYEKAKIFVLSSYNEGFGLVLLEAAHYKTARLAVKSVGSSMLIKNGVDGLRVDFNKQDFAKALKKLIKDESFRKALANEASKIDLSKYKLENVLNLWEDIFHKIGVYK